MEIPTSPEKAVGPHFHARHGTKTIPIFLPTDGETCWSLLPSSVKMQCSVKMQSLQDAMRMSMSKGVFSHKKRGVAKIGGVLKRKRVITYFHTN